jgi:chromosomal replication initiator protein
MDAEQAWLAARGQLQTEMPKAAYDTWVKDVEFIGFEDGSYILGVKNAYARDWLHSRLSSTVTRLLTGLLNRTVEVQFIVWQTAILSKKEKEHPEICEFEEFQTPNPSINLRYTFQNFVVGPSNRLAHAASLAVAERPAQAYNPLFLYGGVGLGKTHLLHAIGNVCHSQGLEVLYVSSEVFTNDLINAIRSHTTQAFRDKYRNIDVLLVDDIQFIAGKESTQEEFFHTFNTLHGQDKQIVVCSDRPPKALITLEERLCSRFEWGLAADIQPPDLETRLAILHAKGDKIGCSVSDDLLELIARRVQSNIRELEGALTRVAAFADLSGLPLSPQLVETALGDLLPRRKDIAPKDIIQIVAEVYGVSQENLLGRDRSRLIALPRQIAMFLMRHEANISLPQIGEALGGRDHTTVMYACDKISEMMENDDRFRRQVLQIKERLYGVEEGTLQRS